MKSTIKTNKFPKVLSLVVVIAVQLTIWHFAMKDDKDLDRLSFLVAPTIGSCCIIPERRTTGSFRTFAQAVQEDIPWDQYEPQQQEQLHHQPWILQPLFRVAFEYAIMEPLTPINTTCQQPPTLLREPPSKHDCQEWKHSAFSGKVRSRPLKIGHAINFGFDVDTLEIHLREICDVVDKIFIMEATTSHNGLWNSKPLAWEAVKHQSRFQFCSHKIVHFVMDDADVTFQRKPDAWTLESLQEQKRWEKILQWNAKTKFFASDDIIGFGDADEIASRYNLHLLKYCYWRDDYPLDVGIWFPMGRIHQTFRTDFPVPGHPYSLGDPTFHVFGRAVHQMTRATMAQEKPFYPSRNRGRSPNHILGGMHMTHYGYLVYQLLKRMTCTECPQPKKFLDEMATTARSGNWNELEMAWSQPVENWKPRIASLDEIWDRDDVMERQQLVYLPWFYECNRHRYSMWEGKPDRRTAQLTSDAVE
jgi:hypothetical protein